VMTVGIVHTEPTCTDNCAHLSTVEEINTVDENDGFTKVLRRKKRCVSPKKEKQTHMITSKNMTNKVSEGIKDMKTKNTGFECINSKPSRLN
jgi:hypothetical protein